MSAAELAYILYQAPVLVAVHAAEMLPDCDDMAEFTTPGAAPRARAAALGQPRRQRAAARGRSGAAGAAPRDPDRRGTGRPRGRARAGTRRAARHGRGQRDPRGPGRGRRRGERAVDGASSRSATRARRSGGSTTRPVLLLPVAAGDALRHRRRRPRSCGCASIPTTARSTRSSRAVARPRSRTRALYWVEIWRAGGVEAEERAAWRGLVAAHGSGPRRGGSSQQYRPLNLADAAGEATPTSSSSIVADAPLPPPSAAVARSGRRCGGRRRRGEPPQRVQALDARVGAARAAEIAATLRPVNFDDAAAAQRTAATTPVLVAFLRAARSRRRADRSGRGRSAARARPAARPLRPARLRGPATPVVVRRARPVRTPLSSGPDPPAPPGDAAHAGRRRPRRPRRAALDGRLRARGRGRHGLPRRRSTAAQADGFDRLLVARGLR